MLKNYIYFLFTIGLVVNIYSNKYTQGGESSVRPGIPPHKKSSHNQTIRCC